jgi:hypothetical protein
MKPRFAHDCSRCRFLSSTVVGVRPYDLYFCGASDDLLTARFGDDPSDRYTLPMAVALKMVKRGESDYMREALLIAYHIVESSSSSEVELSDGDVGKGRGVDVTPPPDPVGDLVDWTEAVRAAERAASALADVDVVGNEARGTLALVCKDAAVASDAYRFLEDHADELHLVAEKPKSRRLVYLHHHRAERGG